MKSLLAALVLVVSLTPVASRGEAAATLAPIFTQHDWINGMPSAASLRGKVVVVDLFTFNCYNCKNVTPNLQSLHRAKAGSVAIVGIHCPETEYERERSNVVTQLRSQGVVWPVAIDNEFAVWHAFGVNAWPTQLIFDREGRLRKTIVGDSQDQLVDATIEKLLAE